MSNYINIDEEVLELTPEVFKVLSKDDDFKLTKTEDFRKYFVLSGDNVTGPLSIVNVQGKPGVKVFNNANGWDQFSYIRTSPIVKVIDATDTAVTFETEGGRYKLEKVSKETFPEDSFKDLNDDDYKLKD